MVGKDERVVRAIVRAMTPLHVSVRTPKESSTCRAREKKCAGLGAECDSGGPEAECDEAHADHCWGPTPEANAMVNFMSSSAGVLCKCEELKLDCKAVSACPGTPDQFARLPL